MEEIREENLSFGEWLTDKAVSYIGSWINILIQSIIIIGWIVINVGLLKHPYDPYPFILLNLALSFMAAFGQPLILMSTLRLERIDRHISKENYMLSLQSDTMLKEVIAKLEQDRKVTLDLLKSKQETNDLLIKFLLKVNKDNDKEPTWEI